MTAGFSALFIIWKIAIRNVWRSRRRSVAAFLTLSICAAMSIITLGLARGISRQMKRSVVEMRTGHLRATPENTQHERFEMPKLASGLRRGWVVAPRLFLLGMAASRRDAAARFSLQFPLGYELQRGRPPESPCEAVADANGDAWVGAQLEVPLKDCPLLSITGSLVFAMEPAGAPPRIFLPANALRELAGFSGTQRNPPPAADDPALAPSRFDDIDQLPSLDAIPQKSIYKKWKMPSFKPVYPPLPAADTLTLRVRVVRAAPVQLHAVDASAERHFALPRSVVLGNWFSEDTNTGGELDFPVVAGAALARRMGVSIGDMLSLDIFDAHGIPRDLRCRIDGIVSAQDPAIDAAVLLAPLKPAIIGLGYVSPAGNPLVSEFSILLPPGEDPRGARSRLQAAVPPPVVVHTWQEILPGLRSATAFQEGLVYMILLIVLFMAASGVLNSFAMSILERTWEFGLMKALGFRPQTLVGMILVEASVLVAAALAAGGAAGALACREIEREGLDLRFLFHDGFTFAGVWLRPVWHAQFDAATVVIPAAALAIAALAAALWTALRAARMPVRDALTRQE